MYETEDYPELIDLLRKHTELVQQSDYLQGNYAWALYRTGQLNDAAAELAKLRAKRDDANDRILAVNIAIASGDWHSLLDFIEQEWKNRANRTAEDLLRAGQLAHQLGAGRSKELIQEAAKKGYNDPKILIGCYSAAVSAGWEDSEAATWLERAAVLSGEDGPVQRFSLQDLMDRQPDWQQRESQTWERLHSGSMPIFAGAHLLHRSLVDLFLLPALANPKQIDPRKRGLVLAYSGARVVVPCPYKILGFDPTALLTIGLLGLTSKLFAAFDLIVIPHSTLGWLFEERQRVQFHQPSQIKDALEIKRLLDADSLLKFESSTPFDRELAGEIGDELAAMVADSEADFGKDLRQRIVVRPSPVHRLGSLMEEEADLAKHQDRICGCLDVVEALKREGQLTAAEEQRARAYLALREKPWPNRPQIESGAVLYLDELAVSYLQHLSLLGKIKLAGFVGLLPQSEITQGDGYIRYANLVSNATEILDKLREDLAEGIRTGKVSLANSSKIAAEAPDGQLRQHPTFSIFETAKVADAIVIDDRHFNQHGNVDGPSGRKPLLTTLDILPVVEADPAQQIEHRTNLRRSGLALMPVNPAELTALISGAPIKEGNLVETAELKAVRENTLQVRMSNSFQFPQEHNWWDNHVRACLEAIKSEWHRDMDETRARARSNWLLDLLDVRGWSHRLKVQGQPGAAQVRYRGQILLLQNLLTGVPRPVKLKYWQWLEEALLERVRTQEPQIYDAVVDQIRNMIDQAASRIDGGDDGE